MHERGPVSGAVAALLAATGNRPVVTVTVALGPGMDPAAARTAWAGTAAAAATVSWNAARDTLQCLACGRDYPGDRLTACPDCDGDGLVVAAAPAIAITAWQLGEAG